MQQNFFSMTKITNKEEAVKMIEVCAIKEAEATKNGDYKTNNKYARYEAECTKYLYQHGQLQALYEYLEHENPSVRLSAAYALLPLYEEDCKKVLSELVKGNYGMCGLDAKMILKQWNTGELIFPYQNNQVKKSSPKKENEPSIKVNNKVEQENGEVFSPAILRLSRIFGCPPANDIELRNEDCGFYVRLNRETKELTVNVNTSVNPYTQDLVAVYKERLDCFKAFEHVATISAEHPSKLGFMKILLTIPIEKATDDVLIQIKDTIDFIYKEWKPNETLVCFKVEYNEATSYFEGEWWMPTRAVIKNERYDFSDEMKYDEAMWELVQGEYDEFENSDSFALIVPSEFQKIWDSTEYDYKPKLW